MHITTVLLVKILHGVVRATGSPDQVTQQVLQAIAKSKVSSQSLRDWHSSMDHGPSSAQSDSRQIAYLALAVAFLVHQSQTAQQTTAKDLDFVWTLICAALQSRQLQSGLMSASRSAQGFPAIPLCSIINNGDIDIHFRLHVWLPDSQRGEPGFKIHSHQAFAQSWVLAGTGKDRAYTVEPVWDETSATHSKYALAWASEKGLSPKYSTRQKHSRVVNTGNHVRVNPSRTAIHQKGMSYSIPAGAFHSSEIKPDVMHATLFLFDGSQGFVRDAPVLGPKEALSHTQLRGSAGISIAELAELVDRMKKGEVHLSQAREHSRCS